MDDRVANWSWRIWNARLFSVAPRLHRLLQGYLTAHHCDSSSSFLLPLSVGGPDPFYTTWKSRDMDANWFSSLASSCQGCSSALLQKPVLVSVTLHNRQHYPTRSFTWRMRHKSPSAPSFPYNLHTPFENTLQRGHVFLTSCLSLSLPSWNFHSSLGEEGVSFLSSFMERISLTSYPGLYISLTYGTL